MTKTPEELTKEWKEGKLDRGWYFVKTMHGFIQPMYYLITRACGELVKGFAEEPEDRVAEVLAHCNYTEYKAMQDHILYLEKCISIYEQKEKQHTNDSIEYNKLEKENNNLRALLRECYKKADEALQEIQKDCEADEWTIYHYKNVQEFYNLLTRINAAIGESEE